jgi:hypothetical protein
MGGAEYADMSTALDVGRDVVALCSHLPLKCTFAFSIETGKKDEADMHGTQRKASETAFAIR